MRVLAIDYGTKNTGLAITDYSRILSSPLMTISANNDEELINKLKKAIDSYLNEIDTIVVGYPLLLSGNKNTTTLKVEKFIELLKNNFKNINILTINEQFTTYAAQEDLYDVGLGHKTIRKNKDKVSACIILDSYLKSL